ncbi:MAG: hypothetical protein IPQ07_16175 [Myxococcales bacterium]|nr:hypothetical protein [Myxococcales bacterium]
MQMLERIFATLSVYEEFGRPPAGRQNTLETMGLTEVVYPNLPARPPHFQSLDDAEWKLFLSSLLDVARSSGCVFRPVFSSEQAKANELEELLPYIGKSLVLHAPEPDDDDDDDEPPIDEGKSKIVALIPKLNADRSRFVAYASRVANTTGGSPEELLKSAFNSLGNLVSTGCKWLKRGAEDGSLQIRLEHLELKAHHSPPLVSAESQAIHFRSVRGVVASRTESGPIREPVSQEVDAWRSRHAIRRVLDDERLGIWAVEHTAQVDVDSLESEEAAFREGRRNLLSSSTTMEMGVDIGGLVSCP